MILIDEISMIGGEMLERIDLRLKEITGNFDAAFGGLHIILIGDLWQLPPDRATPIWKQKSSESMVSNYGEELLFMN